MMDLLIRIMLTYLIHGAAVILSFAIYKVPIQKNHKQITALAILMGSVYYYVRFGLHSQMYFPITLTTFIVGLMVIRKYPIIYSLIICASGYFIGSIIDELITYSIMLKFDVTINELINSNYLYVLSHVIASSLLIALAFILRLADIGFMFIVRRFSNRKWILKGHNFIWAMLIFVGMFAIQLSISWVDLIGLHRYTLIGIIILYICTLIHQYFENRKILRDRGYETERK